MAVHAKAARSGVYQYLGKEIDPEGKAFQADQVVNVYRSPEEVFKAESLGSFVGKPITDDHPSKPVTAANWRDLARGTIMGAVKEGDYVGFDLAFLDAGLIKAVDDGKRELSNGYSSEIVIGDGVAPDGTPYQASQVDISGNHVAVVEKGRAGSHCRIGDAAICDPILSDEVRAVLTDGQTYSGGSDSNKNGSTNAVRQSGEIQMPHTLMIDGLQVTEVSDQAKAAIEKLQGQFAAADTARAKAEGEVATLTTDKAKLEGEKAALETQLKDANDPAKLQAAATARATLVNKAMALAPNIVTDGKSDADIRKEVVTARLGDDAKDFDDAKIEGAFGALAKDAAPRDPVRATIASGVATITNDNGASVRDLARAAQF